MKQVPMYCITQVDTEQTSLVDDDTLEEKLNIMAESVVDSVLLASTQMVAGTNSNQEHAGIPNWDPESQFLTTGDSETGQYR